MSDDRPFRITNYLGAGQFQYNGTSGEWQIQQYSDPRWNKVAGFDIFIWEDRIDVSGWTKEGMTAFFAAQYLQRSAPYSVVGAAPPTGGAEVIDTVYVSDVPLKTNWWAAPQGFTLPTVDSNADWMTIKFASTQVFAQTTTQPITMVQSDSMGFGSGDPTASDTLYIYRVAFPSKDSPANNDQVTCPELRYVAEGICTEEPEFVYLTRLRRSFELRQNG